VDEVFLPRRLWLVPALPRNAAGKLPRENLIALLAQHLKGESGK
jgi:acyl-coenzyme A synthetase/AMP-(fatty) acid ligase